MPWTYSQTTGELTDPTGADAGTGYSGGGVGYNNPADQGDENVGPIPQGTWGIGPSFTHAVAGPVTMRLTPAAGTDPLGRDGFMIHGDTQQHADDPTPANSASHGCIILARTVRSAIDASPDKTLNVTV
jgi:hypothetical protein